MSDLIGRTLGPYEILDEIGHGGMANVYRAVQPSVSREVAIKVLPAHLLQDRTFLERFNREVEIIARLQHPRILPVYDSGEENGLPYIVMAYLPGGTLADRIHQASGGLPLNEAVQWVEQIAEGLDYAHKQGIIHRDFKPSNVLLDREGNPYLADFGIARMAGGTAHLTAGGIVGTPAYIAPETARVGGVSPLVDVYALGVTIYEMLTGRHPYQADTPMGVLMAHMGHPIPNVCDLRPDLPDVVQNVIDRAMAKDPVDRFQSAGELAQALREAVLAPAVSTRRSGRPVQMAARSDVPTMDVAEPAVADAISRTRRARPAFRPVMWAGIGAVAIGVLVGVAALGGLFNPHMQPTGEATGQATTEPTAESVPTSSSTEFPKDVTDGAVARLGKGNIWQIAFSTGGVLSTPPTTDTYRLAVASTTGLYVYRGDTFEQLWSRPLLFGAWCVAPEGLSPIVTACTSDGVKRWDISTGQLGRLWTEDYARKLAISPDGKTLATIAGEGRSIDLRTDTSDAKLFTLLGHTADIEDLAFSPDGRILASASDDKTVILWDVVTGQQIRSLADHTDTVTSVVFSPDGNTLMSGSDDDTIVFWSSGSGKTLRTLKAYTAINSLALSPDGKILASGMNNGPVILWDAVTGQQLRTLIGHRGIVGSMVFSTDGKTLFSAADDGTVIAWDPESGNQLRALAGHTPHLLSVAFSPDGKQLASGTAVGSAIIWDSATYQPLQTLFSPGIVGSYTVEVPDASKMHYYSIDNAIFSPDGATLATLSGDVDLWDIATGKTRLTLSVDPEAIAYSAKDGTLAVVTYSGKVLLFDGTSSQPLRTFDTQPAPVRTPTMFEPPPPPPVEALTFSPDGSIIATGSEDKTVTLWDAATGKALQTLSGHSGLVHSVAFSPDGKILAAGVDDGTIVMWNAADGTQIRTLAGPSGDVVSLAFSPDGALLASASGDVALWDVSTGQQVKNLSSSATGVTFSPDGQVLAVSSRDGTIVLQDVAQLSGKK